MKEIYKFNRYLNEFKNKKIMVIGDLMIDRYIQGDVNRISPEAPVPIVELHNGEHNVFGGAGNVFSNLVSLGCKEVCLVGVVGNDSDGSFIRSHVKDVGHNFYGIFTEPGRTTTVKTRIVSQQQQIVRLDRETTDLIQPVTKGMIQEFIKTVDEECDQDTYTTENGSDIVTKIRPLQNKGG